LIAVRDLVPGAVKTEGPFPLGLASADESAARFARETAKIGMQIAVRCIRLIDEGQDPLAAVELWQSPQEGA
jgi:hypothetical protein